MMPNSGMKISSMEELINWLEPIEQSEISSDIRANVKAELKRLRSNISLILAFTSNSELFRSDTDAQLKDAVTDLRRECFLINGTVGKMLMLQTLRVERWSDYPSVISEQYAAMTEAARQMCMLCDPPRIQQLANALC